jgi:hypothetical protein
MAEGFDFPRQVRREHGRPRTGSHDFDFLRDRMLATDGSSFLAKGETVRQYVLKYRPRDLPPETWNAIAPLVQEIAPLVAFTPGSARSAASLLTQHLWWCHDIGLPLEKRIVFHPDTIDRFAVEACAGYSEGTKGNYRNLLAKCGEAAVGPELYRPRPLPVKRPDRVAPYSRGDVAALYAWARGLRTSFMRTNAEVLLDVILSTGATAFEATRLVGTDFVEDEFGIVLNICVGQRPRTVPVRYELEEAIHALAMRSGENPVWHPERKRIQNSQISHFIGKCGAGDAPKLNPQRLRVTWIVRQLEARVGMRELAAAAGTEASAVAAYAPYLAEPDWTEARRALRAGPQ